LQIYVDSNLELLLILSIELGTTPEYWSIAAGTNTTEPTKKLKKVGPSYTTTIGKPKKKLEKYKWYRR